MTAGIVGPATLDKVCAAVPSELPGERPSEIYKRLGEGALVTVRHALRQLFAAGRVAFEGADCNRRYRRIA